MSGKSVYKRTLPPVEIVRIFDLIQNQRDAFISVKPPNYSSPTKTKHNAVLSSKMSRVQSAQKGRYRNLLYSDQKQSQQVNNQNILVTKL